MDPALRAYHLRELQIALSSDHPDHWMPKLPSGGGRLLDIGCGAGQTLIALDLRGWTAVGLDVDLAALRLGTELREEHQRTALPLLAAGAEALPFADQSFDYVVSRVALPYTHIPSVIAEVARILRPGGTIWAMLHPPSMFKWSNIGSLRSAIYHAYIAVNSLSFRYCGCQFRYPLNRARIESYQTPAGMERCLNNHGLEVFDVLRDEKHFRIQARRKGTS